MRTSALVTVLALALTIACDQSPTRSAAPSADGPVATDELGVALGVGTARFLAADPLASATAGISGVALPAAFDSVMAGSNNVFPHSRPGMRYQQVFVDLEVGGARTIRELCLRPAVTHSSPELVQQITIKMGSTSFGPDTIGPHFDANFLSDSVTVFSGDFVMPATGTGTVDDWVACAEFSVPFEYTGGHLLVEMINRSASAPDVWFADFCIAGDDCRATRLWSTSPTATFAGVVARNQGLVMRLSDGVLDVEVDIEPGSDRNPVSLRARGKLPVAVLTTADFDAAEVNPDSVILGAGTGSGTPVARRRNGSRFAALEDVDGDGDLDLVVHFEVRALVEHGHLAPSTTELVLEGKTRDDRPFRGRDAVDPVGR